MNWRAGQSRVSFLLLAPSAFLACLEFRARLWLRPVETLNLPAPAVREGGMNGVSTHDISRAVYLAARLIPGTHCLAQSLAVRAMMARAGRRGKLRIGVSTSEGFRAHAWVTEDGETVHGKIEGEFTPLEEGRAVKWQ